MTYPYHAPKAAKVHHEIKRYCAGRTVKAKTLLRAYDPEDMRTSVTDCIADLMHLCHQQGYEWPECFERAAMHFNAEVMGGEHG